MAANAPLVVGPPGAAHGLAVAPQLPFGADPGTIMGWLLESTATETLENISRSLELGFHRLVNNVQGIHDVGYEDVMRDMIAKIVNSDTLTPYLVTTNIYNNVVRVTVVHSIARYSAGFGGSKALHGHTVALLGETVGTQLPMLVRFMVYPTEDFMHALAMEEVTVPLDAQVTTYFAKLAALEVMPNTTEAQGGVNMNLANLCPIPLAWAPYFMNFKTPFVALNMGKALVATLDDVTQRTRASPMLDWLRATCVRLGHNADDRRQSLLDQGFEPTAPDAWVIMWMQNKLMPYRKAMPAAMVAPPAMGAMGAPVLPNGALTSNANGKEYSQLETSLIQAVCGLTDAQ
jgi:hypothetical protein